MLTYAGAFALGRITGPHLGGDTGLAVVLLSGQALSLSLSLSLNTGLAVVLLSREALPPLRSRP